MTKKKNWVQLVWWIGLYIFWVIIFQKRAFSFSRTATVEFCYLLFIAGNYYLNVYYTIPVFLYRKKYAGFVSVMFAGIVAAALLRVPLAMFLNQNLFLVQRPVPGFSTLFVNSFLNIFIWVVCIVAGKLIIDRFHFQQHVDEVEKQKERAELDFLNAQFNPHFLFNSINSIYGNIDKHNTTARNMLLTFSDMLRYQLYDCNSNAINIEKEMNYIRNYVALQKARKEESVIIELHIGENLAGFSIAPLLFIAFIENSFKYVSNYENKPNEVKITLVRNNNQLFFKTFNTKESINGRKMIDHGGIGITNVKRRLELLYPGKHTLSIQNNEHSHEVMLNIEL